MCRYNKLCCSQILSLQYQTVWLTSREHTRCRLSSEMNAATHALRLSPMGPSLLSLDKWTSMTSNSGRSWTASEVVPSEMELSERSLTSVWTSWVLYCSMALDMLVMLLQSTSSTASSAFSTACVEYEESFINKQTFVVMHEKL